MSPSTVQCMAAAQLPSVQEIHQQHHFGVHWTLQLTHQLHLQKTQKQVQQVVCNCVQCVRIDPASTRWHNGRLEVPDCWSRLSDCDSPWLKKVFVGDQLWAEPFHNLTLYFEEDAPVLVSGLESIFVEFGPPAQILLDNSALFWSVQMQHLTEKWGIYLQFRCAYWPLGNGIVEQIHRLIKWTAVHVESSSKNAVFWYNAAPLANSSSPSSILLQSGCRWPT